MAPVDEVTQYRRRIDDSIARFSAAHDEWEAEEAERQQRRNRMTAGPARLIEQTRTRLQRVVTSDEETGAGDPGVEHGSDERTAADSERRTGRPAGSGKSGRSRLQEKKRQRSDRTLFTGRVAACFLAALVFLGTATAWGAQEWFNAKFNEIAALSPNSDAIHNGAIQVGDENFLIIGSDSRKGANAGANIGTAAQIPGARSDTVMLVHIPEDRHRVVVVSFLRDLEVRRPACQRWNPKTGSYADETVPAARHVKLNTAYAVGGPKCITKLIQQITHMRIQHFVGVNFSGFQNMVGAVGGVTVDVAQPIVDRELGTVVEQAGKTHLKGKQALEFMRARKVIGDPTAGYGRVERQQQFIGALLDRMLSKDVLLDAGKLTALVNAFTGATFGDNIGFDQMLTLGQSMRKMESGNIKFLTVPTTGVANQRGNEVLLEDEANALFSALIQRRPLPGEKPKTSQAAQASNSQARSAQ